MIRWRLVGIVVLLLIAGLVVTGVLSVRVEMKNPLPATAKPFWSDKQSATISIPDALRIWVELARAVKPGVVNVGATVSSQPGMAPAEEFFRRFFEGGPSRRERRSLGSGFVVSPDGYVVTNFHVVRDASEITVRFAELGERRARLVGSDSKTDIALLKVDGNDLPAVALGDSDQLQVGEPVMAIGNPFGLDQTVTTGIVSAKERFIGSGPYDDFIQTDASVNPGNSGGPLIDARGAVVGINTAIFSQGGGSVGIGFAIPINLAKDVLLQLRESGKVTRGYLGVSVFPVTDDVARELRLPSRRGAVVAEIVPGSPAAAAGLQVSDVIVAFGGRDVGDPHDLTRRVAATPPGTRSDVTVVRRDGRHPYSVTVGELREGRQRR
jgi:serine protease Do